MFKSIIFKLLAFVVRAYVYLYRKLLPWRQKEILVAPPASAGSLGDQAMLQGLYDGLARKWFCSLRQVLLPNYEAIQLKNKELLKIDVYGSSAFSDLRLLLLLRRTRLLCVLGADIIDGRYDQGQALYYLHILDLADSIGVSSRLLGFSISETPDPIVINRLKSLNASIVCCARDPVSQKRFVNFTDRKACLVADLAFQLTACAESINALKALERIRHEKQCGARVIALNANVLTNLSDPDRVKNSYIRFINELVSRNNSVSFILVPHDFRGKESDHLCHSKIIAELDQTAKARTWLLAPPVHAWDVKAIAAACDLVVTGRMHFAIAALGSGVPTIGIGYMGKFEGLFGYFGLESLLITPQQAYDNQELVKKVGEVLPDLSFYQEHISSKIKGVKDLSRKNFSCL